MARIERKYLAHYINVGTVDEPVFVRLGKDLEEYAPELSAQVDKKRNILGQTQVTISGYEKSGSVEAYYAEAGDPLFEKLQKIIDGDLVLEELAVQVAEVKLWESGEAGFPAVLENAYIEVSSYGGDTTGYQIPFTIHYTGEKVKGTFDVSTKTFTAGQ